MPPLDNEIFKNKVTRILYEKNKFEYNQKLLNEINDKKFNQTSFDKLANGKIENIILDSINDNNRFSGSSVKLLYSRPINSFALIFDEKTDVFVAKIKKFYTTDITRDSKEFLNYREQANIIIRDSMYSSYDNILDEKYNVTINQKTLERVKNYFR